MGKLINKAYVGTKESWNNKHERFENFRKVNDAEIYIHCYGNDCDIALVTTQEWRDYLHGDGKEPPEESDD